jgi:hypothetical protein
MNKMKYVTKNSMVAKWGGGGGGGKKETGEDYEYLNHVSSTSSSCLILVSAPYFDLTHETMKTKR